MEIRKRRNHTDVKLRLLLLIIHVICKRNLSYLGNSNDVSVEKADIKYREREKREENFSRGIEEVFEWVMIFSLIF